MNNNVSVKKEVKSYIQKIVGTIYGPSLVVGIVERDGGEYIHLKENGEEDYFVSLEQWPELLA
ncbi:MULTISPECIES: hypothetical protein [Bacillus]|uniref:Uncharacterized protein n=1 Tax=Bacillus glycinifermentans TaxID=1664069 RepID=A0A0T6BN90_9BACI|nr:MULTISPECIES: hypothetical protein [Bacillus]KRT93093.1 hypothetical protein AB447_203935 [Bacillus glycinifermentans]MEC0341926.1 hypothetical protein [Bacillus sonorensis]MEC0457388.1 hypothetical protein [Bacillus sonorensis]MEC0487904.1 hypothetical protein [Bacillus glycinifermentans]MEC0530645.1 hypothetical protein [Bacillus sonorensis]